MLVSIIIPTHNSQKYLKETIYSALNQTYKFFELIIVDDCSDDQTIKIVKEIQKKDKRIKFFSLNNIDSKPTGSGSKARNEGINKAKGEIIAFLDSDDLWDKNKLQKQISEFKPSTIISFTKCKYWFRGRVNKERFIKEKFINFSLNNLPEGILLYNPLRLSSVMIKKSFFDKVKFSEDKEANAAEDLDLWLNLFFGDKKIKKKISYIKEYLTVIRRHSGNLSKNYKSNVIKNIYLISVFMIRIKRYKNLRYFISGIFFRIIQLFFKTYHKKIKNFFKILILSFIFLYFFFFKSPVFWYLGNNLIYSTKLEPTDVIVVFSGHGDVDYKNKSYQERYIETKKLLENKISEKVFLIGRNQILPENKIISALLINDGYSLKSIKTVDTYKSNTKDNILYIGSLLEKQNINSLTFVTSPYHSLRSKLIWKKYFPKLKVKFNNNYYLNPKETKWNTSLKKVLVIIYEYTAIFYNYLRGWL